MKSINLLFVLALSSILIPGSAALAADSCSCGSGSTDAAQCCKSGPDLEAIMDHVKLKDGNNLVAVTSSGYKIYAVASGGSVTGWEVHDSANNVLRSDVRKAANEDNLRIWWQPLKGPGLFVEAPASVIEP